jgi:predicted SAM-dependent methyltransferase
MIEELFSLGMKRELPIFKDWKGREVNINIGAGKQIIENTKNLDLPNYDANVDRIPYVDNSVDVIHCYHLIEHLDDVPFFLSECQRVLKSGGIMNICVPHFSCSAAWQDFTHTRGVAVDAFKNLFATEFYHKINWEFNINGSILIAITERNTAIIAQLEKC